MRLWVSGRGPWRHETSGAIVSVVYITMLIVAVLVVVMVPILAAILSRPAPARRVPSPRRRRLSYESSLPFSEIPANGSSSSDFGSITVIEATVSLAPLIRISVTPCVARPLRLIWEQGIRII